MVLILVGCQPTEKESTTETAISVPDKYESLNAKYTQVALTANLSGLSENQKEMIPILIEVGQIMDQLYWYEAYGDKDGLLSSLEDDAKEFVKINYGPWDRLDGNKPFIDGVGAKPAGANFYPSDMTKEEFEASEIIDKSTCGRRVATIDTLPQAICSSSTKSS